jgi:hypothetical protein
MPTSDSERVEALCALPADELESELRALVAAGEESVPLLRALEEHSTGPLRKRVRRALHRLRSRGVAIAEQPSAAAGGVLKAVEGPTEEGVLSGLDPLGRRVAFLMVPGRAGADLFEVALSDTDGVLGLRSHRVRRRDARGFLRSLRSDSGSRTVEVSGGEVRALIARALELAEGPAAPAERSALRELAAAAGPCTPGERLRDQRGLESIDSASLETRIEELIEKGKLIPWPVLSERARVLHEELAGIETSPLVLSDFQKSERRTEIMAAAAAELFDPQARERWAARVEETAVFLEAEGDRDGTGVLLALADRLRGSEAALDIGFLARSLDLTLEITGQAQREEQSDKLIVPG